MNEEELIHINGIREVLYQAIQIRNITLKPEHSKELYDFMNYQDKEIERLNNKIEDLEVLIELIYHEVFLNDEQQKLLNSIIIGGDKE